MVLPEYLVTKPLCLVVMPMHQSGAEPSGRGHFDCVFEQAVAPAVEAAGMLVVRAEDPQFAGTGSSVLLDQLALADLAVVDVSMGGAHALYSLGVRAALRPEDETLLIFAQMYPPGPAVDTSDALSYLLDPQGGFGETEAASLRAALQHRILSRASRAGSRRVADNPLVRLLQAWRPPLIARLKTDVFRDQVIYSNRYKQRLTHARQQHDVRALGQIEGEFGDMHGVEAAALVDLLLSYRAVDAWQAMVELVSRMPALLRATVLVREQLGFALNRLGRDDEALVVLQAVLDEQGPSSETCPLMGRVYKDRWMRARQAGDAEAAAVALDRAIDAYISGFEADSRDSYPGINALTLLDLRGDDESQAQKRGLLPVVMYAVDRRIGSGEADYWDYATRLELAVLADDAAAAQPALADALVQVREVWEPKNTSGNLRLIRAERRGRGDHQAWLDNIIVQLERAAN